MVHRRDQVVCMVVVVLQGVLLIPGRFWSSVKGSAIGGASLSC